MKKIMDVIPAEVKRNAGILRKRNTSLNPLLGMGIAPSLTCKGGVGWDQNKQMKYAYSEIFRIFHNVEKYVFIYKIMV